MEILERFRIFCFVREVQDSKVEELYGKTVQYADHWDKGVHIQMELYALGVFPGQVTLSGLEWRP